MHSSDISSLATARGHFSRRDWLRGSLGALVLAGATPSWAQGAYPSRPIRVIVPWAPGGLVDVGGRAVAEGLFKHLGQPATVENVAGAAGTIGADLVAKAPANGYTLLVATSSLAIDVAGKRKTAYDPLKDFQPVSLLGDTDSIIVVAKDSPIHSLRALLDAAKARPNGLVYGTPGIGSPAHLFVEYLCQKAAIRALHVPYNRSPAINDLMGGRLDFMVATAAVASNHVKNGLLRPLAVTGRQRLQALPEIPTATQAGLPGYEATQWLGVFAPQGTPAAVVDSLNKAIASTVTDPAVASYLQRSLITPRHSTPAQLAAELEKEALKWTSVIQTAGIQLG